MFLPVHSIRLRGSLRSSPAPGSAGSRLPLRRASAVSTQASSSTATTGVGLHADFAPYVSAGYAIAQSDSQLAWNVYADVPEAGGETVIYNRPWTPLPEDNRVGPAYDLSHAAVAGAESVALRPTIGDVLLFNARNPHEVRSAESKSGRRRIGVGSFIGSLPNGSLVLWS